VAVGLVLHGISVARKRRQPAAPTPEQAILTLEDRNRTWKNDREASALFTSSRAEVWDLALVDR
jgi:hypothetical protein